MNRPPDICKFVFVCAFEDWQVQAAPRVKSDLGGHTETLRAIAEAHRVHIYDDHTEADRETMRKRLESIGAPDSVAHPPEGHSAGMLLGVGLPRWWVDK